MEKQKLSGRSILIVEPDPFIAVDLQDTFVQEGARILTAYRLERALQLADRPTLSAAVIASALGTADRGALCLRLVERKVPFIFHSERMTHELGEWPDVPVITKPADGSQVVEVVASLLGAVPVAETKALTPRMPTVFPSSSRRSGSSSCGRTNRVKLVDIDEVQSLTDGEDQEC